MPWILDEIGRNDEVDWHFAADQDLPPTMSLATSVPDRALWPLRIVKADA